MLAQPRSWRDGEVDRQCVVRDADGAAGAGQREPGAVRRPRAAAVRVRRPRVRVAGFSATHAEYEAVRASGSRFLIAIDHENPVNACVVSEGDRYAVVDVVVGEARYTVLAQNPRHSWVDRQGGAARRRRARR